MAERIGSGDGRRRSPRIEPSGRRKDTGPRRRECPPNQGSMRLPTIGWMRKIRNAGRKMASPKTVHPLVDRSAAMLSAERVTAVGRRQRWQALRNASSLIVGIWHEHHAASLFSCSTPAAYAAGVISLSAPCGRSSFPGASPRRAVELLEPRGTPSDSSSRRAARR